MLFCCGCRCALMENGINVGGATLPEWQSKRMVQVGLENRYFGPSQNFRNTTNLAALNHVPLDRFEPQGYIPELGPAEEQRERRKIACNDKNDKEGKNVPSARAWTLREAKYLRERWT